VLVFLERVIWAQSVLPIVQVALIAAWLRRDTRVGAFGWGLAGALVGQIHMAGFFFVPPLVAFTRFVSRRETRWGAWLAGSVLGALPAVPWLLYLAARDRPAVAGSSPWLRFRLEFYQYFFSDPSGLASSYLVGRDIERLMEYPRVAGHPTYLVLVAHLALAVATLAVARRAIREVLRRRGSWQALFFGERTDTDVLLASTLLGMGALMTLPSISIHRHYMLALFPLTFVWTARAALREPGGERLLLALAGGSLVVSVGILSFLHANGGADDFGKTWAAQVRDGTSPDDAKSFRP